MIVCLPRSGLVTIDEPLLRVFLACEAWSRTYNVPVELCAVDRPGRAFHSPNAPSGTRSAVVRPGRPEAGLSALLCDWLTWTVARPAWVECVGPGVAVVAAPLADVAGSAPVRDSGPASA